MGNSRVRERFELALDARQVMGILAGSLVILGGTFILGVSVGRQAGAARAPVVTAPKDPLARLDEPLAPREEPPPVLKAHQALTDSRSIDKTLPVPAVRTVSAPPPAPVPSAAPTQAPVPSAATAVAVKPAAQPAPAPVTAPVAAAPPTRNAAPAARPATSSPRVAASARPEGGGSRGGYAIQVGSMPTREDAERIAKKHAARHPRIVSADVPGKGRWYRVVIGAYATQEAAKRQLAALTRVGVSGIVTTVR
jgi:cell division septation protein DedD